MRDRRLGYRVGVFAALWLGIGLGASAWSDTQASQLVFGSFSSKENAHNWAQKLSQNLATDITVEIYVDQASVSWYRVVSPKNLVPATLNRLSRRATAAGVQHWRKPSSDQLTGSVLVDPNQKQDAAHVPQPTLSPRNPAAPIPRVRPPSPANQGVEPSSVTTIDQQPAAEAPSDSAARTRLTSNRSSLEWDLGLQTRLFNQRGVFGQDRVEGSVSAQAEYFHGWDADRQSITITPFLRVDSADNDRTHFDFREFYYSRVGENWDFHVGARRVFWGVTEFNHLVDIINQTDLVENIDTEDKLGQPMLQLSLVRSWGILDLHALIGARERTFPGNDGRLRLPFPVSNSATYESGAEEFRVDAAVRWSHHIGPFEFGLHHFSGTSRDPLFVPVPRGGAGGIVLQPHYPVIDQSGIDAQYFVGDWAFKFEGFSRSGFGLGGSSDRYAAFNAGFERTLVGVLGTRTDLGLVVEYLFDERDDEAFNTLFEHDIAIGGRFQMNDFADTQALFGIIFDPENDEYVVSLEASRRLSDSWSFTIEGRVFASGERLRADDLLPVLFDPEFKSAPLQDDDYLQIEFKKFL